MPSARRIDALYSANVAAPRRPRGAVVRAVAAVVDRAAAAGLDGAHDALSGATQEHLVERRQPRRQAVQRQPELGDDVAQQVQVVRRRRPSPRRARRRRRPSAAPVARPATSSSPRGPTSTVTTPGALEQRVGRARDDEPAGVDHHDVVAHLLHVVEQVGRHQHRDAERAEPGDEREHLLAAERVEPGGRLVEQHQLRDRRRAPGRAWCAGACRSRTRRSGGSGPRRGRRGRGCRTPAGGRRGPAARSARRTSTRRRPRSGRAAGSRARACSRAASARRSGRRRRRCRTPRRGPRSGGRGRAAAGTSSSCRRRWRRRGRCARAAPRRSGRRARSRPGSAW